MTCDMAASTRDGPRRAHYHTASVNISAQRNAWHLPSAQAELPPSASASTNGSASGNRSNRDTALDTGRCTATIIRTRLLLDHVIRPGSPLCMQPAWVRFGALRRVRLRSALCSSVKPSSPSPLVADHIAGCKISFQRLVHTCSSYYHACYCCTLRTPWGCRRVLRSGQRHRRANLALTLTCPPGRRS